MLFKRITSAVVLMLITIAAFLLGGPFLLIMLYFTSCVAFIELTRAMGVHARKAVCNEIEFVGLFGITAYYLIAYSCGFHVRLILPMIATMLALMVAYVLLFPKYHINQILATYFAMFYAPVMLSFIYFIRELEEGIFLVWLIVVVSWVCDTGAFAIGMGLGKHKLAPMLSPKKTIEGAIGGIVSATVVGVLFLNWFVEESWILLAIICIIGSILAQIGDLAASAIKRNYEIKDYGRLIPGHGGIMDRFDSVIFIAPIIYFILITYR
ncbi:MAG: phosphatidate cytidylyltransferase [Eubacteriales bacterium]